MDTQPTPKPKSRKIWWILGGVAFIVIAAAASGNSGTQTPSAGTANVAQQVAQPAAVQQEVQSQDIQPTGQPQIAQPIVQPQPQSQSQPQAQPQQDTLSNNNTYVNSDGNTVHSPAYSNSGVPAGATAQCRDGSYSFSQHRSGTCSHHGGVMRWL
jgi:hypothetical protein